MTITIDLPPPHAKRLQELSRERGLDPDDCVSQVVQDALTVDPASDHPQRALPEDPGTIALLKSWLAEAATMDEQARQEAEADLQAFKEAMNDSRRAVGARILYP